LLINRNFALLWSGQAISIFGDMLFSTTLVLWIVNRMAKNQPWAPLAVAGVLLATYVPTILLSPLAGVFSDRWDKRQTMITVDIIRTITLLGMILAAIPLAATKDLFSLIGLLGVVYLVVFILNAADRFFRPAMLVLIGDIVPQTEQEKAIALGQISVSLAGVVAPPVASLLFFKISIQWLLLINMLTFVCSVITIQLIHPPHLETTATQEQTKNILKEFRVGLHYILHNNILVTLIICDFIAMFGISALSVLDIFFLTENLHASQALYGLMETALGVGMIIGAVLSAALLARIGSLRVFYISTIMVGILLIVYARMTSFIPGIIILLIAGCPAAALGIVVGPLILQVAPRELIGRISSAFDLVTTVASIIGTFVVSFLDGVLLHNFHSTILGMSFGPVDVILVGAGAMIFVSGLYAMSRFRGISPEQRKIGK